MHIPAYNSFIQLYFHLPTMAWVRWRVIEAVFQNWMFVLLPLLTCLTGKELFIAPVFQSYKTYGKQGTKTWRYCSTRMVPCENVEYKRSYMHPPHTTHHYTYTHTWWASLQFLSTDSTHKALDSSRLLKKTPAQGTTGLLCNPESLWLQNKLCIQMSGGMKRKRNKQMGWSQLECL